MSAAERQSPAIPGFSGVGAPNWLQSRELIPLLARHGNEIDGVVLDLGCGRSPFRPLFSKASRYIRIDYQAVDDEVIVADASALPLADASVDAIVLSQVIGDVPDLPGLFRELSRVLAPGGRILVYETITYPQHDAPHDCWRVLPGGLKWAAEQAGLTVAEVHMLGGYFTQVAMNWNIFMVGALAHWPITRPLATALRATGNIACAGLDHLWMRRDLASDYFACVRKNAGAATGAVS